MSTDCEPPPDLGHSDNEPPNVLAPSKASISAVPPSSYSMSSPSCQLTAVPKELSAVRSDLILDGVVLIAVDSSASMPERCVVELQPCMIGYVESTHRQQQSVTSNELARLLAYIYYTHARHDRGVTGKSSVAALSSSSVFNQSSPTININQRTSKSASLTLVVDCRRANGNSPDIVYTLLGKAIAKLMNWLPECISSIFWVDSSSTSSVSSAINIDEDDDDDATVCYTREYSTQLAMNALLNTILQHQTQLNMNVPMLSPDKMRTVDVSSLHSELPDVQLSQALQLQHAHGHGQGTSAGVDTQQYNTQWVHFRQTVEQFFSACNQVTKWYIQLYSELNDFAAVDVWTVQLVQVQEIILTVNARLIEIEQCEQFNIVRTEGAERVARLATDYPALAAAQQHSYIRAMDKAAHVHQDMRHIMDKAAANVNARCTHLHTVLTARQFIMNAMNLIEWCSSVARPKATAAMQTSVQLVRLRLQEQKYDEFFVAAKQRISDGEEMLLKHEYLCVDCDTESSDLLSESLPGSPAPAALPDMLKQVSFSSVQRALLTSTWKQLMGELESTVQLLYKARDTITDSLVAHHMLDKVYEWTLNNMKWSSQLGLLINQALESTSYNMDSIKKLQHKVHHQLITYPTTELAHLPEYAERMPTIKPQVDALLPKCAVALVSMQSNESTLHGIIARKYTSTSQDVSTPNANNTTATTTGDDEVFADAPPTHLAPHRHSTASSSLVSTTIPARDRSPSADTEYEQPITITLTHASPENTECKAPGGDREEPVVCWRRKSYAGNNTNSSVSSVSSNMRPQSTHMRHSVSTQSTLMHSTLLEEVHSDEEHVNMRYITDDMTDQVCTNMSKQTLRRRQGERRQPLGSHAETRHKHTMSTSSIASAASGLTAATSPGDRSSVQGISPPAVTTPIDRRSRAGSARFALVQKVKKPFRKLMKRSSTMDELNSVCDEQEMQQRTQALLANEHLSPIHRHSSVHSLLSLDDNSAVCSTSPDSSSSTHCVSHDAVDSTPTSSTPHPDNSSTSQTPTATPSSNMPRLPCAISVSAQQLPCTPSTASPDQRMQCNVLKELIMTERAYVQSLQYVVHHYIPEMSRNDLPQEIRGKKYTVFGNIEKICEFHALDFLPSLQACISTNNDMDSLCVEVANCFLMHREQWHLYALYNKNKCCSDVRMADAGSAFFRPRQLVLQDPLDLSSYLLKPVQRMGKYSLLLKQLLKTIQDCEYNKETRDMLMQAEQMVTFQLRHGNDLLAMDLIRQCDVTLAEQGELLRQDEFTVYEHGRRGVHTRRVFLFEHLVLLAKPKPQRTVNAKPTSYAARLLADTYAYKGSIKTSDLGMTEDVHNDGRKFGLWFRRVNGPGPNYVLQASNENIRRDWLAEISQLLWKQSHRNREMRKKESVNMGIGERASCLNLQSSVDRIQDRSVSLSASQLHKVTRFREQQHSNSQSSQASHPADNCAHTPTSCSSGNVSLCSSEQSVMQQSKRPHSLISTGTNSSASSAGSQHGSRTANTPRSCESGICADLSTLHEMPFDLDQQSVADSQSSEVSCALNTHESVLLTHDQNTAVQI